MPRTSAVLPLAVLLLALLAGCRTTAATASTSTSTYVVPAHARSPAGPVGRLQRLGLTVHEQARSVDGNCAADSSGQVLAFFRAHPCTALFRVLLDVRDRQGAALVAVAWVDMPTETTAEQLHTLLDRSGTGNLTELTAPFNDRYHAGVQGGVTVAEAELEPVGAGPADPTGIVNAAIG